MISSHLADMGEVLVAIGRRTVTHAECDRKHSELVKRMDGKCMIKGGIAAGISTPIAGLVYFVGKAWGWW